MFLLQETECGAYGKRVPYEEKVPGKWGKSLNSAWSSESITNDISGKDLTVGQMAIQEVSVPQNIGKEAADAVEEVAKIDIPNQGGKDSVPDPQGDGRSVDENEAAGVVLLCIEAQINDHAVTFLIDNVASECFVTTQFAVENELLLNNTKEKLKTHFADGSV